MDAKAPELALFCIEAPALCAGTQTVLTGLCLNAEDSGLLALCNGRLRSVRMVFSAADLATMESQQAVAKHLLEGASPFGRAFFLWPGRRLAVAASAH